MIGVVGILNVGCGDTKLSFDPTNQAECIRAARIVTDMIRRGYALMVATGKCSGAEQINTHHTDQSQDYKCVIEIAPDSAAKMMIVQKMRETNGGAGAGLERSGKRRLIGVLPFRFPSV